MLQHDVGVLYAPPAFGKTVGAAAIVAQREVSTMMLVHRTDLLLQWQERLNASLELPKGTLRLMGGGKKKLTGKIDIAVSQSLCRRENLAELLDGYGHIIIDECHHQTGQSEIYSWPDRNTGSSQWSPSDSLCAVRVLLATGRLIGEGAVRGSPAPGTR